MKTNFNPTIKTILKIIALALCAAVSVVSVLFIYQRQSIIMYVTLSIAVAVMILFWKPLKALFSKITKHRAGRIVLGVIIAFIAVIVIYSAVISALMLGAMFKAPPNDKEDVTLIVLGCQVRGEQPSLMLSRRIETARIYLNDNPEVIAVLSGGQGSGEWISEAEAIYRRLAADGIDEKRLILEDRSTSTFENIALSKPIIEENSLPKNVAIVTDGFHQYRAQFYADKMGLTPFAVPSKTPFYVLPYYWLREIAAITVQVVFGRNEPAG